MVTFYTPKCCKLYDDLFPLYCATGWGGGVRKTYCARSRNDVRPLTSRSNAMPSKKTMESLVTSRSNAMPSKKTMESLDDVCRCKNCSKAWPHVSR